MTRFIAAVALLILAACSAPAKPSPTLPEDRGRAWDKAALEDVVQFVRSQKTTGFLIIDHGQTIAEHYWPLPDDEASRSFRASFVHAEMNGGVLREDVASQQKSLTALLLGIGVDKGLIDTERSVTSYIGPGWSKATAGQEDQIRVRNLMEMNSGLSEKLTFEAQAGSLFFYNTPAYAVLKRVLERSTGQTLSDLTLDWLTRPAGMNDTSWERRPAVFGDIGNPTGLVTTPRDIALMGQLVLNHGRGPNGRPIISEAQLDALLTSSATNPAYGRLWWLNNGAYAIDSGPGSPRREGRFIPSAPADTVSALGANGRKLYVTPSMQLIVVRTGQAPIDGGFNDNLWKLLMKAAPAG